MRGEAEPDASPEIAMRGVELATGKRPVGLSYLIRHDRPLALGGPLLHLATGIQRLADAKLMAAAPEFTDVLLRLLTSPFLTAHDLSWQTVPIRDAAWDLLVRVAPHLEIRQ